MSANTLYYTLSTIPQVLAAVAAILGAFTFFRIQALERILIGHGKSVLARWGTVGYGFDNTNQNDRQRRRLADAIDRESVEEVRNVIRPWEATSRRGAAEVVVESADFHYGVLYGAFRRALHTIVGNPGVQTLDIDERRNRVVIGVLSGTELGAINAAIARDNDASVFEVVEVSKPTLLKSLTAREIPLLAGTQIHAASAVAGDYCTMGYTVSR